MEENINRMVWYKTLVITPFLCVSQGFMRKDHAACVKAVQNILTLRFLKFEVCIDCQHFVLITFECVFSLSRVNPYGELRTWSC